MREGAGGAALRAAFGLHDPSIALTKAGERLLVRMHTSLADLEEATEGDIFARPPTGTEPRQHIRIWARSCCEQRK
jgi:DNA-binding transcriptional LysR family regulator